MLVGARFTKGGANLKRHVYLGKIKQARRHEVKEFEILETFITLGEFYAGKFASRGKQIHVSVEREGNDDYGAPTMASALARVRHLSNKRWPKEKYDGLKETSQDHRQEASLSSNQAEEGEVSVRQPKLQNQESPQRSPEEWRDGGSVPTWVRISSDGWISVP